MTLRLARRAPVGFAVGLLETGGFAPNLLSGKKRGEFTAPPQKVWELIKDFDGWQNWHPAVASTEITSGKGNARGTVRVLVLKDGAKITESLVHYQPKIFSYTYRIIDSPPPVTDYASPVSVKPFKTASVVT